MKYRIPHINLFWFPLSCTYSNNLFYTQSQHLIAREKKEKQKFGRHKITFDGAWFKLIKGSCSSDNRSLSHKAICQKMHFQG